MMNNKGLIIGQTALFNHCDMGLIDVEVMQKIPLGEFYTGKLKKIHFKEVRLEGAASDAMNLLKQGHTVHVFVRPSDLLLHN